MSALLSVIEGGIRCVKINAYLEQVLGFTNVSRLAGGIISYTRELEQQKLREELELGNINVTKSDDIADSENEDCGFSMISKSENTNVNDKSGTGTHLTRNVVGSKFKVSKLRFIARIFSSLLPSPL